MSNQFEELMAREKFVKEEGFTTPAGISKLSGNPASYEKDLLNKLVEAGRIARVELHFPRYPSDGFGDDNKITYFMRFDLSQKIRQEEKKPENPTNKAYEYFDDTSQIRRYTGRDFAHITSVRWKLHTEGKEGFLIPGVIKC